MVFSPRGSYAGAKAFSVPCGRCIGCRLAKSSDWAIRMTHEAKLYGANNAFVTFTYADEFLPSDGSLSVEAAQSLLVRLRRRTNLDAGLDRDSRSRVRFFIAGEYGDATWRPHYHAILFNFWPDDAKPWREARGNRTYRSAWVEKHVWPYGHVEIGRVSAQSCGYVARYAMKKLTGEQAPTFYYRPHPLTGQYYQVIPEFARMSRRPGIGSGWFDLYSQDAFPSDFLVVNGSKRPVPDYYKRKLAELEQLRVKNRRIIAAQTPARLEDQTVKRLLVRQEVKTLQAQQLKRKVD